MRQSQFERLLQDVGDTKDGVDTILSTCLDRIVHTSNKVDQIEADAERTLRWVECLVRELDDRKEQIEKRPTVGMLYAVSICSFAFGLACGTFL